MSLLRSRALRTPLCSLLSPMGARRLGSASAAPNHGLALSLREMLKTAADRRDESWQKRFTDMVGDATLVPAKEQVSAGPDGFLYMNFLLPRAAPPESSYSLAYLRERDTDFLIRNGFGATISRAEGHVDWVFSYGDLVNFHVSGAFTMAASPKEPTDTGVPLEGTDNYPDGTEVICKEPSDSYLPRAARAAIREFLEANDVVSPQVALLTRREGGAEVTELAFLVDAAQDPVLAQALAWYLPRHYIGVFILKGQGISGDDL